MPDLLLARTSTEGDDTNITTLARRLDQWIKLNTDFLFLEAKATWERMSRTKAKRSFDEYKKKKYKYKSTEKIFIANRNLTEELESYFV